MIRTTESKLPGLVLIVDDDRDTLALISLTLRRAGYEVIEARSGRAALEMMNSNSPDVILLDMMMPDMDGLETLRKLKREHAWPPPVIFLTAKGGMQDKVNGIDAGAFRYITKPAKKDDLLAAVQAGIDERRKRMERPPEEKW